MSRDQFEQLMNDFGNSLGISDLKPDEFGLCCLNVGDVAFHLLVNPEGSTITLFTEIGELAEDAEPEILKNLLAANYFWTGTQGATLGVQPESGAVALAQRLPLSAVAVADLERLMKQFVEVAEKGLPGVAGPASEAVAATGDQPYQSANSVRV